MLVVFLHREEVAMGRMCKCMCLLIKFLVFMKQAKQTGWVLATLNETFSKNKYIMYKLGRHVGRGVTQRRERGGE